MIGKITGTLDEIGEEWVIIDVGGVGYEVHCPTRTLAGLPASGSSTTLFIETHVREDQIRLFGFTSANERYWFRLLQSVQGVGARVALAVLGTLSTGELADAIALGETAQITRAPGVGPKVAQRIAAELKDKAPREAGGLSVAAAVAGGAGDVAGARSDAISALVNLGYGRAEASAAVAGALKLAGPSAEAGELIRLGLKELA
ncbi:MAG: Holliday junction branch migration protein RuvA [Rhizobiales bacterium]|nr:Holliday junction branch migration protein RuvA [Hyphomicrobiales bacterium]